MEKLSHFVLSAQTKKNLARTTGLDYEKLKNLDYEQEIAQVEKRTGRKITYNQHERVDGCPLKTLIEREM